MSLPYNGECVGCQANNHMRVLFLFVNGEEDNEESISRGKTERARAHHPSRKRLYSLKAIGRTGVCGRLLLNSDLSAISSHNFRPTPIAS
jgi:hypothetical protein